MKFYLYSIRNLVNGKRYIGITGNITKRWYAHRTNKLKTAVSKAIQKYGAENFEFKSLVIGEESYIKELEIKAIAAFKTKAPNGYNLTDGGEGTTGYKQSLTQRARRSKALTGHKHTLGCIERIRNSNRGKKRSLETRERLRQSHLGKVQSVETKEKLSQALRGRVFSAALRKKLSRAARHRKPKQK